MKSRSYRRPKREKAACGLQMPWTRGKVIKSWHGEEMEAKGRSGQAGMESKGAAIGIVNRRA